MTKKEVIERLSIMIMFAGSKKNKEALEYAINVIKEDERYGKN